MVAFFRGHIRGGNQLTRALVGILALPLPPMKRVHAIGKFAYNHQFAYDSVYSK